MLKFCLVVERDAEQSQWLYSFRSHFGIPILQTVLHGFMVNEYHRMRIASFPVSQARDHVCLVFPRRLLLARQVGQAIGNPKKRPVPDDAASF